MENRSLLKILFGVIVFGLMVSCMGMEDSDPSSLQVPEVKTFDLKDNGSLVFELSATVDKNLAGRIAECGFYYGKNKNMSDAECIECKMLGGTFSADVTLREYGETFYVCAYLSNGTGNAELCSETKKVIIKEFEEYVEFGVPALVSYDRATKVASASISYEVKDGVDVTARGLCYGTSKDIAISGNHVKTSDLSSESVIYEVPDIEVGKTYYVRPYLYGGDELAYGESQELHAYAVPVVETTEVTEVTDLSAVCGGNVTDDGGAEITAKGVVWSTSPNPTISLSTKTDEGKGAGEFSAMMAGLFPGTEYYVRAYATNLQGTSYGEQCTFITTGDPIDFMEAANCFVITQAGEYAFCTVKGNCSESVGTVKSVEVLWESFGNSTAPKVGDLIKSVFYSDGGIIFQTANTFREGNAVIAAKDASGSILWSWHIWLTDQPKGQVYYNNAGTMMDRNLGATSATPGDVGALGLLYQWGRKDPFLGSSSISSNVEAKSTITWPSAVTSSSSRGTNAYAVEHPTTFITCNDSNHDWYYTGTSSTDNTRWQSAKTIYDPCPAGWRVPDGGSNGVWEKAGFDDHYYDDSDRGMLFGSGISSPSTWYPAAGYCGYISGLLSNTGDSGHYWSVAPDSIYAYSLFFRNNGYVYPTFSTYGAYGYSVRCLQE